MLLKVTERNWGLAGPGDWEKRSWKIDADGTYLLKTIYHPVDPGDTESAGETEAAAVSKAAHGIGTDGSSEGIHRCILAG